MPELGYTVLSEEHGPDAITSSVAAAEDRGFDFAMVSDHFHPWTTAQGQSPFVWGVLGSIAEATSTIPVGTAVTAPIIRIHPAIVAQAAATAATQLPERFVFGVGTGEQLNEHVVGERWPPHDRRLEMLEEAIEIIRLLWEGGTKTYRGAQYTVEDARVFTLPDELPPIVVAAGGQRAAAAAGHYGDGLMTTAPDEDLIARFEAANDDTAGQYYGQLDVCYAEDEDAAIQTAYEQWPNTALSGELSQELRTPAHFEQAAEMVEPADVAESFVCGPHADRYIDEIQSYVDAGFTHIQLHQIRDEQEPFVKFMAEEVLPSVS